MSNEFFALDSEGGEPLWYLQILMTIKASGDKTGGALGLLDFKTPAGQTPLHVHHKEDEGWYLLEGRISCTCGDETVTAGPGAGKREVPPAGGRAWARDHRAPAMGQEGGSQAMTVLEYDTFTEGAVDPSKWVPLQLPTPDGSMWS